MPSTDNEKLELSSGAFENGVSNSSDNEVVTSSSVSEGWIHVADVNKPRSNSNSSKSISEPQKDVPLTLLNLVQILEFAEESTIMEMRLVNSLIHQHIERNRHRFARYPVRSVQLKSTSLNAEPAIFSIDRGRKLREGQLVDRLEKDIGSNTHLLHHFKPESFIYHVVTQTVDGDNSLQLEPEKEVRDFCLPKYWYYEISEVRFTLTNKPSSIIIPALARFRNLKEVHLAGIIGPGRLATILDIMPEVRSVRIEVSLLPEMKMDSTAFVSNDDDLTTLIEKTKNARLITFDNVANEYTNGKLIEFLMTAHFDAETVIRFLNWPQNPPAFRQWLFNNTQVTASTFYGQEGIMPELYFPNRFEFVHRNTRFSLYFATHAPIPNLPPPL